MELIIISPGLDLHFNGRVVKDVLIYSLYSIISFLF